MPEQQQIRDAAALLLQERTDDDIERLTGVDLMWLLELRASRAAAPAGRDRVGDLIEGP